MFSSSATQAEKKETIQETIKTKMVEITVQLKCTIFKSVCNNQSSKAFELAAAYLQIRKGQWKEKNN